MSLIQLQELSIGFRGPLLLDQVSCQIEAGGRIGLLGRNGSGKTTLMRILSGVVQPDAGRCIIDPKIKISLLSQDVPRDLQGRVDVVEYGCFHCDALLELSGLIKGKGKGYHDLRRKSTETT